MSLQVNQKGASAQGDVVAGNKTVEVNNYYPSKHVRAVEQLLDKLQAEIEKNQKVRNTIEALAHFKPRQAQDGITGLKAKLEAGNRSNEYFDALEKKELFAKLLEKWSLYASAQEIFAYLLAQADYQFNYFVLPQIESLTEIEVNGLVDERIIIPTISECGASVFTLNHSTAMGMLYWLADLCFIRWHK